MTTFSPQQIAKFLRVFSTGVEFFQPDDTEGSITLGFRRKLHDALDQLTPAQRTELAKADARAAELFARHRGSPDPYFDIAALGEIVQIANSERAAHAA